MFLNPGTFNNSLQGAMADALLMELNVDRAAQLCSDGPFNERMAVYADFTKIGTASLTAASVAAAGWNRYLDENEDVILRSNVLTFVANGAPDPITAGGVILVEDTPGDPVWLSFPLFNPWPINVANESRQFILEINMSTFTCVCKQIDS